MIKVSILALRNAVLASIADARYVFVKVNDFLQQSGKPPLFEVQLVGLSKEVSLDNGLFLLHPDKIAEEVKETNLVIIPSVTGNVIGSTHMNKDFGIWIAQQYKSGAEVA